MQEFVNHAPVPITSTTPITPEISSQSRKIKKNGADNATSPNSFKPPQKGGHMKFRKKRNSYPLRLRKQQQQRLLIPCTPLPFFL
jgi:hypothetical protein